LSPGVVASPKRKTPGVTFAWDSTKDTTKGAKLYLKKMRRT